MTLSRFLLDFDRYFDNLANQKVNYPPFNTFKNGSKTYLEMALAGWSEDEISIKVRDGNRLIIEGNSLQEEALPEDGYRGISQKDFVREFSMPSGSDVTETKFRNGLLTVIIEQNVSDERVIPINMEKQSAKKLLQE